jgi:CheY-like chemotaxis protein
MTSMLGRLIGEHIELVAVTGAGLWRVKADPGQVEQVIMNLAVNARDAMPDGGRLTIQTANQDLQPATAARLGGEPGPHVMLAVTDTGIGMSHETREHIFEPFFTTKEVGKGTGLGLATVYGVVVQHGGCLQVDTEPGRGTTFRIFLPRVEAERAACEPPEREEEAPRGSETILLVEDDDGVRDLARETLEERGYTVLLASRPGEALALAERDPSTIHLVLTDVVMPEMSGPALVRRLARLVPRARVLFMSGYTDTALGHHGVLDAETALLEKPFTPAALAKKVREVLGAPRGR